MSRALVSVYDKTDLEDFSRFLESLELEIVSSGGTARYLSERGLRVTPVGDVTGFPEVLDGRVKTLHPVVHAGILARRGNPEDMATLRKHSIKKVDWVVVNLYPFREKQRELDDEAELLEFIDIGGPTLIRAAAKNFRDILVVSDPSDYPWIMEEYHRCGNIDISGRRYLAEKVFRTMSEYDRGIADFLREDHAGRD